MKIRIIIFYLGITVPNGYAQNLVPNPSFELNLGCPTGSSQISLATPWQGVTTNSTDYYNVCGSGGATVPVSGPNYQPARTGSAYGGVWVINAFGGDYREYLQVQLDSPLETDSCYLVDFYCNPNGYTKWAIGNIGACLTTAAINDVGPGTWGLVLQHSPQIASTGIISDTAAWTRVSGYYTALGGEQFITIGSFVTDSLTDTLNIGGSYPGSYYFIEDVRVQKLLACDTTTAVHAIDISKNVSIYPNPVQSEVFISAKNINLLTIVIVDILGRPLNNNGSFVKNDSFRFDAEGLPMGIYFIKISDNNSVITKKFVKN
jgi:hypothetical protein